MNAVNPHFEFLLGVLYDDFLAPEHLADLESSSITIATARLQRIRTVPPSMINALLGFPVPRVEHAYLLPFANPAGGWMPHTRMKIFPPLTTDKGAIKYLQPRRSGVRIFFPLATLDAVLHSDAEIYFCEGEKKSLSVSQLGLPTIAMCGIEGWHAAGSRDLHPDLDVVRLRSRAVTVVPDADWRVNPTVNAAVQRLVAALARRGARPSVLDLHEVTA